MTAHPMLDQALANVRARLTVGWPLLVLALALYAPADGLTRIVLLAVGAFLATARVPAAPAGKPRKTTSPTTTPKVAPTVPPHRKGGEEK
ncbi:hypothetical protein ACFVXG_20475 [Kitasatospora sp. NPDC058162]|uniref:hypothetical protein n=1 Tax=Kitasatospora sp. NPDC058162 TaxID=3346362 RepID=UPI0036DDF3FC